MSRHLSTLNISSKSMHAFLSNLANRQTDKHGQKHLPPPLSEVTSQDLFVKPSRFKSIQYVLIGKQHVVMWYGEPPDAPEAVPIPITPESKRSLPWFTGYSAVKFHWNLSITISAIFLAVLNPCPVPGSELWPNPAQNLTKSCRPPQISTNKI